MKSLQCKRKLYYVAVLKAEKTTLKLPQKTRNTLILLPFNRIPWGNSRYDFHCCYSLWQALCDLVHYWLTHSTTKNERHKIGSILLSYCRFCKRQQLSGNKLWLKLFPSNTILTIFYMVVQVVEVMIAKHLHSSLSQQSRTLTWQTECWVPQAHQL